MSDGRRNSRDYDYYDRHRDERGGGNRYGKRENMNVGSRSGPGGGENRYDDRDRNLNLNGRRRMYSEDYNSRGGNRDDGDNYSKRRRMGEDDEFRRRDRRHPQRGGDGGGRDRRHRVPQKKKKPEWPSAFEDAGGKYVFDARSGLFYDAESDYFYDPKNKLYYSNEKKKYFRYSPDNKAKHEDIFEEVHPGNNAICQMTAIPGKDNGSNNVQGKDSSQDLVLQALQGNNANLTISKQDKKKINICIKKKFTGSANLKKKFLAKEELAEQQLAREKQSLALKEHKADIEKWAKRAEQENGGDDDTGTIEVRKIKMTKAGKPICWYVQTQFEEVIEFERKII